MAEFRISFDVGAGWVVYTPYDNNLVWGNYNEINPAIYRVRLTGNVTFAGTEYTALINFKDAGNDYVPVLVEQDSSPSTSGWVTIFEGNSDLRKAWDENRSSITLDKFNNGADVYDNLLSNYTTKYSIKSFGLTQYGIITPSHTSTTTDCVKQAGALSVANYKLAFDINGFASVAGFPDPRWAYFLWRSTDGDGSHNFETMAFEYAVDSAWLYTEIRMLISGDYVARWVKLPPVVAWTETRAPYVGYDFQRFPDVMGALLVNAVSTLTLTEATALSYAGLFDSVTPFTQYAYFDYTLYQIAEAASVAKTGFKQSEISLKDCFDIMAAFGLHWYLDGSALKFKHDSEIVTTGTLDLSTQTANLKRSDYIEANEIPDAETWQLNDTKGSVHAGALTSVWGSFQMYYRSGNPILSNIKKNVYTINLSTNVPSLMADLSNTDKNNFALVETVDNTAVPRVVYGTNPDYNSRLTAEGFFNNQTKWRYGTSAALASKLKIGLLSLINLETRPLLKIPTIFYHQDLLTNYDMAKAITTTAGTGITKSIKQSLNNDIAELEIII